VNPGFVLDNSVAMRWCFEETASSYSESVLQRLGAGEEAYVPALWYYEVVSVLTKAQRIGSLTASSVQTFLDDLRVFTITPDSLKVAVIFSDVRRLADTYGLTGYDAAYLELAMRKAVPLATLDDELRRAARSAKVEILGME
jgi:predicted nucleic acid-binding protein